MLTEGGCGRIHRNGGGAAGHAASGVADDYGKLRSVVRARRGWRGVAGGSGTTDSHAVFAPLVAQRGGARSSHAEGGGLPRRDSLACWLRG